MRGLLSYHFLRWFAGDLKNRRKQPASITTDQQFETGVEMTVGSNSLYSEEVRANRISDLNNLQNEEELNMKNET